MARTVDGDRIVEIHILADPARPAAFSLGCPTPGTAAGAPSA
ncbi:MULTISPECIES: hypothetical protein [unclassified Streptomyces]